MSNATIERAAEEGTRYLPCAGCGEPRHVKYLDALTLDMSAGLSSNDGSAWLVVYFCDGRQPCKERAIDRLARWCECKGVEMIGRNQSERPPR